MIITVTLNPAVDKTIEVDNFSLGEVNRVSSSRLDAGGKGINVSKVIKSLGGKSRAIGVLAGKNGSFIKDYLNSIGIENDFINVEGETRTNIKIVDKVRHTNTDINEDGPSIPDEKTDELYERFLHTADKNSIVVLSGSVPKNVNKNIYKIWIQKVNEKGGKAVLDADGELFKEGIEAGPYLVKPNIYELEQLFGKKISGIDEAVKISRKFFDYGIKIAAISLGSDGALFVKKDAAILVHGLKVEVKSTVGAGDSMVAALALAMDKGYDFEKAAKLSSACGTASVMTSGTQAADLNSILQIEKQVKIEYVNY